MKKKCYISSLLIIVLIGIFAYISFKDDRSNTLKKVVYNGSSLLINIDGVTSNALPTSGNYYLVDYECKSENTKLSWDNTNYKLSISNENKNGDVVCNLEFKSNPKLSDMPVGSYVSYIGVGGMVGDAAVDCQINGSASNSTETVETEAPNSCLGQNAREDIDTNGNTYGYCFSKSYKYYTTGWRIAYIDDSGKPVIISAGSPECNNRESIAGNKTYIKKANTKALKYCNSDYVDGDCSCLDSDSDGYCDCTDSDNDGLCDEIENGTVDAWAISDIDFYNMTKAISGVGKRLVSSSSSLGDSGGTLGTTKYCYNKLSYEECGYNNDLIDNGGYYWFAARYSSSSKTGVDWGASGRKVVTYSNERACGLRPVISLSSSVVVTGGKGTMEEPYTILNNSVVINGGNKYLSSSDDMSNVTLSLIRLSDVTKMCVSVGSSSCSDYVDFASTYTLDLSNVSNGKKTVYVYYKNAKGEIVASTSDSIIVDTDGPTNSSINISGTDGLFRTLILSSTGADFMCFSTTSSVASECGDWVEYSTSYTLVLPEGAGTRIVHAFFKDVSGNIDGPYSVTTTCTNDCEFEYWLDAYNNSNIYLMRNDGATAMAKVSSSSVIWYKDRVQQMKVCGADNYYRSGTAAYIWCIGTDDNAYYKTSYTDKVWNEVNVSSYIDTSTYTYSIYPYGTSYAYIVRSDGRTNRLSSTGIYDTSWSYAEARQMATCSGYSSSRVVCVGTDGKYYYRTSALASGSYTVRSFEKLTSNRTDKNTWIDMYSSTYTHIIETDGTNLYDVRFDYATSTVPTWNTTAIPASEIKTCAGGGYASNSYCLGENNYLYYKSATSTSATWTSVSLLYE